MFFPPTVRSVLGAASVLLTLAAGTAPASPLSSPTQYDTWGNIDIRSVDPSEPTWWQHPQIVAFDGTQHGTLVSNQPFRLGDIVVSGPAPNGQPITVDQPVTLSLWLHGLDYSYLTDPTWTEASNTYPSQTRITNVVSLNGHLDGVISGTGAYDLTLRLDRLQLGGPIMMIPEDHYDFTFPVFLSQLKYPETMHMVGSGQGDRYTVLGEIVPEPAPIAVFVVGLMGLGLRWMRGRRTTEAAVTARS